MPQSHRIEKVNHLIRQEISDLIRGQLKDPRLDTCLSVTEVVTSPDLKYAKIFVSSIGGKKEAQKTLDVLNAASGFLRRELSSNLRLRHIPELNFQWDDSIERGDQILRLLDQVNAEQEE